MMAYPEPQHKDAFDLGQIARRVDGYHEKHRMGVMDAGSTAVYGYMRSNTFVFQSSHEQREDTDPSMKKNAGMTADGVVVYTHAHTSPGASRFERTIDTMTVSFASMYVPVDNVKTELTDAVVKACREYLGK